MPHDKRKRQPIKTAFIHTLGKVDETNCNHSLDQSNTLPLSCWQGLVTLQSVITRSLCVFFCALPKVYIFGRGGISSIQHPLWERLMRRSLAVTNTPIALVSSHLVKIKGGHNHA